MKKKILKVSIVYLVLMLIITPNVKADKICKIYKDYDLFADVTAKSAHEKEITANGKNIIYTKTQAPAGLSKDAKLIKEYQVGIIRTGTSKDNEWTLKDYYDDLKNIINKGKTETLKTSTGDTTIRVYSIEEDKTEGGEPIVIRYIRHGKWRAEGEEETENGFTLESLFKSSIDNLINASIIPTGDLETLDGTGTKIISTKSGEFYEVQVERSIIAKDIEGLNTVSATLTNGEKQDVLISPAVYYREYEYCEETYKAQIDYVYIDGSEAKPSHNEDEIDVSEESYTNKVTSPTIENCTPDKEEVTISIDKDNPKDFYEKVVYTCKPDEEPTENKPTGDALIYIAWIVGIAALGYSVYYFVTLKKSQAK